MKRGIRFFLSAAILPPLRLGCKILGPRSFEKRLKVTRWIVDHGFASEGQRERVRRNASLIRPDLEAGEILRGEHRIFETLSYSWASLIGNGHQNPDELYGRTEVKGIENLLTPFRQGKKVIVTFDHVGPIDEILWTLPRFGLRSYAPVEPLKPPWLLSLMNNCRSRLGEDHRFEPISSGTTRLRIREHLAEGSLILLAIDITSSKRQGSIEIPIGDTSLRFPTGAVKIALEENALLIPALPSWGSDGKSRVVFSDLFPLSHTGDLKWDIESNTRRLLEEVYLPHIQEHWSSWIRLPWLELEPKE